MYKRCQRCNRFFAAMVKQAKYCHKCRGSISHYKRKPLIKKNCKQCDEVFATRRKDKVYCSPNCRQRFHYEFKYGIHTCQTCGKKFKSAKSYRKYCSDECYLKAKRARDTARRRDLHVSI